MKKPIVGLIILSTSFLLVFFMISSSAFPDESGACDSCHDTGDYTIIADETYVEAQQSDEIIIVVTATGTDLIVEVPEDGKDNSNFEFDKILIEDNDDNDENSNTDEIEVEFVITAADSDGEYMILIITRENGGSGLIALAELNVEVIVGEVEKTPFELFFDHNNYYIGGVALIFMFSGIIVFQVKENKKSESEKSIKQKKLSKGLSQDIKKKKITDSEKEDEIDLLPISEKKKTFKIHGILIAVSVILITINIFLIMTDAIEFSFKSIGSLESIDFSDPDTFEDLNRLIHIILGSIGYMAGIIVLFGIYTNAPGKKLKFPLYMMSIGWVFNFLYAYFLNLPVLF